MASIRWRVHELLKYFIAPKATWHKDNFTFIIVQRVYFCVHGKRCRQERKSDWDGRPCCDWFFSRFHQTTHCWQSLAFSSFVSVCLQFAFILKIYVNDTSPIPLMKCACKYMYYSLQFLIIRMLHLQLFIVMKIFVFPFSCVAIWRFINKNGLFMCIYFYLIKISVLQWKYVSHVDVTQKVCCGWGKKIDNCWSRNMQGMENLVTAVELCCHPFLCNVWCYTEAGGSNVND